MLAMVRRALDLVDHRVGEVGSGDVRPTLGVEQRDLTADAVRAVCSPGTQAPYVPAGLTKTRSSSAGACSTSMTRVASPSIASARCCSASSPSTNRGSPAAGRSELNPPTWRYRAPASAQTRASSAYTSTNRPAMSPRGDRAATTASVPGMTRPATSSAEPTS